MPQFNAKRSTPEIDRIIYVQEWEPALAGELLRRCAHRALSESEALDAVQQVASDENLRDLRGGDGELDQRIAAAFGFDSMADMTRFRVVSSLIQVMKEAGWSTCYNGSAFVDKSFQTAAGERTAYGYLSAGDEFNWTLSATYYSEGRNILSACSVLIPKAGWRNAVTDIAQRFTEDVDRVIAGSYAARLTRLTSASDTVQPLQFTPVDAGRPTPFGCSRRPDEPGKYRPPEKEIIAILASGVMVFGHDAEGRFVEYDAENDTYAYEAPIPYDAATGVAYWMEVDNRLPFTSPETLPECDATEQPHLLVCLTDGQLLFGRYIEHSFVGYNARTDRYDHPIRFESGQIEGWLEIVRPDAHDAIPLPECDSPIP